MKEYKALLFDLDMTLLDFSQGEYNALRRTLERYGVEIDAEKHRRYSSINQALWLRHERGEISRNDISRLRFSRFLNEIGLREDPMKIDREFKENLSYEAILMDGAKETCEFLHGKYDLYVISNGTDFIQRRRMQISGLMPYFKAVVTSEQAGAPKPEDEFFDYIFRRELIVPDEALIIGDSLTSDILGGVNYGIDTCLVTKEAVQGDVEPTYTIEKLTDLIELLGYIN
jgi:2-haloacid dehalogenase